MSTGQVVVHKGQLAHVRGFTRNLGGTMLSLAMENLTAVGGNSLGCVDGKVSLTVRGVTVRGGVLLSGPNPSEGQHREPAEH